MLSNNIIYINKMGIGDWGLGIGPNPQSPIPIFTKTFIFYNLFIVLLKSILYIIFID